MVNYKKLRSLNNLALLGAIIAFVILSLWVGKFSRLSIDLPFSRLVQSINSSSFFDVMWLVSWIGDTFLLEFIIGAIVIVLAFLGLHHQAVLSVILSLVAACTGLVLKQIINRPRPDIDKVQVYKELSDKSFPSLHVLTYAVFFGYLLYISQVYLKNRFWKNIFTILSLFMITTVGISRIYLGAHWASDVIGGYLLAFIIINVSIRNQKR